MLEGGYRIQGGVVSAFGRSVQSHLRALFRENKEVGTVAGARHVIECTLNPRLLSQMGLMDGARHVTKRS